MTSIAENAETPSTAGDLEVFLNNALWSEGDVKCPVCGSPDISNWSADEDDETVSVSCPSGCSGDAIATALGLPAAPPGVTLRPEAPAPAPAATAPAEDEDQDEDDEAGPGEAVYTPPLYDDDDEDTPAGVAVERLAALGVADRKFCPLCGTPGGVRVVERSDTVVEVSCRGICSAERLVRYLDRDLPRAVPSVFWWTGRFSVDEDDQGRTAMALEYLWAIGAFESHADAPALFDGGGTLAVVRDGKMREATAADVTARLAKIASWVKGGPKTKGGPRQDGFYPNGSPAFVETDPPPWLVRAILGRGEYRSHGFPRLERVLTAPYYAPDGALVQVGGYHAGSRTYLALAPELTDLAWDEDRMPLDRAVATLREDLLGDFPFVGPADLAHALALILLPFVRDLIRGPTPLHLVGAHVRGTGKSLLARCAAIPAMGRKVAPTTFSEANLMAALRDGSPVTIFDNKTGALRSELLDMVLVEPTIQDPAHGADRSTERTWVLTANNLEVADDTKRRRILIWLDAEVDRPNLRTGPRPGETWRHTDPTLRPWAEDHRADLVRAALSIVGAWVDAGKPAWTERTLGSFEAWAAVMGGILATAGVQGFLGNLDDEPDEDVEELAPFLRAWVQDFGDRELTAAEVVAAVQRGDAVQIAPWLGQDGVGTSSPVGFGKWLGKRRGVPARGLRLVSERKKGLTTWKVSPTAGPPPTL